MTILLSKPEGCLRRKRCAVQCSRLDLGLLLQPRPLARPSRRALRVIRRQTDPVFPVLLVRAIRMRPRDRKSPISAARRSLLGRTDPHWYGSRTRRLLGRRTLPRRVVLIQCLRANVPPPASVLGAEFIDLALTTSLPELVRVRD